LKKLSQTAAVDQLTASVTPSEYRTAGSAE
jgi:hypothetical protein